MFFTKKNLAEIKEMMTETVEPIYARLDVIEEKVDYNSRRIDDLYGRVEKLDAKVDDLYGRVDDLSTRVDDLASDVEDMRYRDNVQHAFRGVRPVQSMEPRLMSTDPLDMELRPYQRLVPRE